VFVFEFEYSKGTFWYRQFAAWVERVKWNFNFKEKKFIIPAVELKKVMGTLMFNHCAGRGGYFDGCSVVQLSGCSVEAVASPTSPNSGSRWLLDSIKLEHPFVYTWDDFNPNLRFFI